MRKDKKWEAVTILTTDPTVFPILKAKLTLGQKPQTQLRQKEAKINS
jgi:hypothetical protein